MRMCVIRKCDYMARNGFRKCFLCLRGQTPDKREESKGDEEE